MDRLNPNSSASAGDAYPEAELLERLREGDEEAFEYLVRRFSGRLLAVARRLLGNEEDARDAVQDAFLSSLKGLDLFQGQSRLSTWLHRIVVNSALMKLRSRTRRPETPIEDLLPSFYEDGHRKNPGGPWQQSADDTLAREETCRMVRSQIDRLPDDYRNVLILRDIELLDTSTTARLLGAEPGLVRVRLHRARQALRTRLEPHMRMAT